MPRRVAWLFALVAVVLFFLAALKSSGAATGLPDWLTDGGLCATALALACWFFPYQPMPPGGAI